MYIKVSTSVSFDFNKENDLNLLDSFTRTHDLREWSCDTTSTGVCYTKTERIMVGAESKESERK